ncbi:MAG TPA: hypothetical protein VGJ64_00825 [Gemmatimonadaceae bacterium]
MATSDTGRRIVIAVIVFTLLCEAIAIATAVPRFGFSHLPRQFIRLTLDIWFSVALYRRRNWARILLGILGAAAAFAMVAFVIVFDGRLRVGALAFLAFIGVGAGIVSIVLFGSSAVRAYFSPSETVSAALDK